MISHLIGLPYDIHNNNGVNCWGLVAAVYKLLGNEVKDFPAKSNDHAVIAAVFAAAFASGEHGFHRVDSPNDYDIVVFNRPTKFGKIYHCGIMLAGKVIHSTSATGGVVYQSLDQAKSGFTGVEFWRK